MLLLWCSDKQQCGNMSTTKNRNSCFSECVDPKYVQLQARFGQTVWKLPHPAWNSDEIWNQSCWSGTSWSVVQVERSRGAQHQLAQLNWSSVAAKTQSLRCHIRRRRPVKLTPSGRVVFAASHLRCRFMASLKRRVQPSRLTEIYRRLKTRAFPLKSFNLFHTGFAW